MLRWTKPLQLFLEVLVSPWQDSWRLGLPSSTTRATDVPLPFPLGNAVHELLSDMGAHPWRRARAAQLLAALTAALEACLGRPARVTDLFSEPAAAWLIGLPASERLFAEGLLCTLKAELTLWQDPGAYGARALGAFKYKRVWHEPQVQLTER